MANQFAPVESSIKEILGELSDKESRQDAVLSLQREIIRDCALAIKNIHTGEKENNAEVIAALEEKISRMRKMDAGLHHNSAQCYQEYVEIRVLDAIFSKKPVPSRKELGVDAVAYLNGLADVVGELRRQLQLSLGNGKRTEAEYAFNAMNSIYDNLMIVKFSSSLVGPLKHKQDVIRGQLEQARSEMLRSR